MHPFLLFHSIGKWLVPPTPPKPKPVSQRIQDSLPQQFSLMYWRNNKQFITFIFFLAGMNRTNLFILVESQDIVSVVEIICVHACPYFISHQHRVVRHESLLLQRLQGSDRERTKRFLHVVQVSLHCIYCRCIHPRVLIGKITITLQGPYWKRDIFNAETLYWSSSIMTSWQHLKDVNSV